MGAECEQVIAAVVVNLWYIVMDFFSIQKLSTHGKDNKSPVEAFNECMARV